MSSDQSRLVQGLSIETGDGVVNLSHNLERLWTAEQRADPRSAKVLAHHAVLLQELHRTLSLMLPRGAALKGLGFKHLVQVLSSLTEPNLTVRRDRLCEGLFILNELRNAIAHGDAKTNVDALERKLHQNFYKDEALNLSTDDIVAFLFAELVFAGHHATLPRATP